VTPTERRAWWSMPELKFRAFLSYSHRDRRIAEKVHARLESFRIDDDLRGRVTSMGPIPATLSPIFRDRQFMLRFRTAMIGAGLHLDLLANLEQAGLTGQ